MFFDKRAVLLETSELTGMPVFALEQLTAAMDDQSIFNFCKTCEGIAVENLKMLMAARVKSQMSLDFWADLTDGLDQSSFEILVVRSSIFPKYMNSKDKL